MTPEGLHAGLHTPTGGTMPDWRGLCEMCEAPPEAPATNSNGVCPCPCHARQVDLACCCVMADDDTTVLVESLERCPVHGGYVSADAHRWRPDDEVLLIDGAE
jgi:hypothetical protein